MPAAAESAPELAQTSVASAPRGSHPAGDGEAFWWLLDHVAQAVVALGDTGSIEFVNLSAARLFARDRTDLMRRGLGELLIPEVSLSDIQALLAEEPGSRDLLARRPDGSTVPVQARATLLPIGGATRIVVSLDDLSSQRAAELALSEIEVKYRTLVEQAPEALVMYDADTERFVDANRRAERLFHFPRAELFSHSSHEYWIALQADGRTSESVWRSFVQRALQRQPQMFEWQIRDGNGVTVACEVRIARVPHSERNLLRCTFTDISARKRDQIIVAGERGVLEMVAANAPLEESLAAVARLVESVSIGCIVSISVLAENGQRFESIVAPRLPPELRAVLERSPIEIRNGSCAAAVYLGHPVIAADSLGDPHWASRVELLREAQLLSTWSVPIRGSNERLVGALGVYRGCVGEPGTGELQLMSDAARLAGIAIERRRAEAALRGSEAKFRGLFESVMEGVYQSTLDGRLISVNPAFVKILGYDTAEELYALPSAAMLYWRGIDRAAFVRLLESDGEVRNIEQTLRRRDGQQIVVLESSRALRDADGRIVAYEGTIADITERKRAEQAIFQEKERAEVTLQSIGDAVITADASGLIDYMNPVAEQLTGWRLHEVHGRPINDVLRIVNDSTREALDNPLLRALETGASVGPTDQSALLDRAGHEIAIQDSASPIRDRNGKTVGAVVVFHDVTRERRLRRALAYQASHDALTGLINRREFDSRLHAALESVQKGEGRYAVLYLDLDQFKLVNDTCGHSAGDRLIREITTLVQSSVRSSDVIARLGGDEFGVLLANCTLEQAGGIAETVRRAVRDHRFVSGDSSLSVGASIGVVEITRDSESVASLMSAADVACYSAKDQGRNRIQLYEADSGRERHREMQWVAQIAKALEERRFELVFQPIQALTPNALRSFHELMVRMRDEQGMLVPPGDFIPAAERFNVMPAIDLWVLQDAVRELREFAPDAELPLLAVNVSGNSLSDAGYFEHALATINEPRIAKALCFEVTETAAVSNLDNAVYFMRELRARGCRFSLDDFGSGLSSFRYLKNLPVDFLKIDGQFISDITTDAVDRSMVQAIVQVGRSLGIATVAEKVENGAVLQLLAELGVDYAQGFHIARPQPIAGLKSFLG